MMATLTSVIRLKAQELLARYQKGERSFADIDLRKADLSEAPLAKIHLRGADLRGARMQRADLRGACLSGAQLGPTRVARILRELLGLLLGVPLTLTLVLGTLLAPAWAATREDEWKWLRAAVVLLGIGVQYLSGLRLRTAATILAGQLLITVLAAPLPTAQSTDGLLFVRFAVAGSLASLLSLGLLAAMPRAGLVGVGLAALGLGVVTMNSSGRDDMMLFGMTSLGLIVLALLGQRLRARALRGTPRDAGLRRFILWIEGLGGADLRGADLTNADLSGADLAGADLRGAQLTRAALGGATGIELARLADTPLASPVVQDLVVRRAEDDTRLDRRGQDLSGLSLREAALRRVILAGARLCDTDLEGADLSEADLSGADLRGAALAGARLDGAVLLGARIDLHTFLRSGWDGQKITDLRGRGAEVVGFEAFPDSVKARVRGELEGLRLRLRGELRALDRLALHGLLVGVLGPDSDCTVQIEPAPDHVTVVSFRSTRAEDLSRLEAAVQQRDWEKPDTGEPGSFMLTEGTAATAVRAGLTELLVHRLILVPADPALNLPGMVLPASLVPAVAPAPVAAAVAAMPPPLPGSARSARASLPGVPEPRSRASLPTVVPDESVTNSSMVTPVRAIDPAALGD